MRTCFAPITDQIFESISYIGEKVYSWCRTATGSGPAEETDGQTDSANEDETYQEVVDAVRSHPAVPRRRRNYPPLNVSNRIVDKFGRARADQNIYDGMENLVLRMVDVDTGIPLRVIMRNSLPLPSVFAGNELIDWIMDYMHIEEDDALYLANLLAKLGFLYPLDDRSLKVNNDIGHYRFQSPYYWKSGIADGSDEDYAAYLTRKRIYCSYNMSEPFTKNEKFLYEMLKRKFADIWSRIESEAVEDIKLTEKYGEEEMQIIFSEQRAFWDLRRPPQGGVQKKIEFEYTRLLMFKPYLEVNNLTFPLRFPGRNSPSIE